MKSKEEAPTRDPGGIVDLETATPTACHACGSLDTKPYTTKPPRHHNGPCTPECDLPGRLCLACRMFTPNA